MKKIARRNGRPPIDATGTGTRVSVRLAAVTYDELYRIASASGCDVAQVIREAIQQRLVLDRRAVSR